VLADFVLVEDPADPHTDVLAAPKAAFLTRGRCLDEL
jgi:hypothetical protein